MEFIATESAFHDGLGGASNAAADAEYHYVLFGNQVDDQHPENAGLYFEFDDQINGSVNNVLSVTIALKVVTFALRDGQSIVVRRGMAQADWLQFLEGIGNTFPAEIVHAAQSTHRPDSQGR